MNWIELTTDEQLDTIREASQVSPQLIFKHSTRCSISRMAKTRLERDGAPATLPFYHLDLLKYRPISNKIAEIFAVHHESPQVLLIHKGECVYEETHNGIDLAELAEQYEQLLA